MEMFEVRTLFKNEYYVKQDSWEQTRMLGYITAQTQSSKKLSVQDIMKFPWEEEYKKSKEEKCVSNEQVKRLSEMARKMQESMSKNNDKV